MQRFLGKNVFAVCGLMATLLASARPQDTRKVTEPVIPPPCAVLKAEMASENGRTLAAGDESKPDTVRIQQALDHCTPGHAVVLEPAGARDSFLSGPLGLRSGVALVIAKGATLFGSRNPRDYDLAPGSCGIVNASGRGCKALINGDGVHGAAVEGDGVIDGRGWANLLGQNVSWWGLAQQAKVTNQNQNCPRLIMMTHSNDFTLYRITLKNPPMYHMMFKDGDGFTAWGVIINTPKAGRNTDGIDPSSASNVTITHCWINAGDDNVSIKAGSDGPSSHITVAYNHFYAGHGMSIGSDTNGGVSAVRVTDLTIDGADNGLRIKSNVSRGGLVDDVIYQDVCIRNTRHPILMDTHYSFYGSSRNLLPVFTGIVLRGVRIEGPGRITLDGLDPKHKLGITFNNVTLGDPAAVRIFARHAAITLGPGPVNFRPSGNDVTVIGTPGRGPASACATKFPPFPVRP